MARTAAMGLRREPQPPMPMVIPERSSATMSSTLPRLSLIGPGSFRRVGVALLHEGGALLVGHAAHVQLVRESLLEAVAALDVDGIDAVERLLGPADDGRTLRRDVRGQLECGGPETSARYDRRHRSVGGKLGRTDGLRRVDHPAHHL